MLGDPPQRPEPAHGLASVGAAVAGEHLGAGVQHQPPRGGAAHHRGQHRQRTVVRGHGPQPHLLAVAEDVHPRVDLVHPGHRGGMGQRGRGPEAHRHRPQSRPAPAAPPPPPSAPLPTARWPGSPPAGRRRHGRHGSAIRPGAGWPPPPPAGPGRPGADRPPAGRSGGAPCPPPARRPMSRRARPRPGPARPGLPRSRRWPPAPPPAAPRPGPPSPAPSPPPGDRRPGCRRGPPPRRTPPPRRPWPCRSLRLPNRPAAGRSQRTCGSWRGAGAAGRSGGPDPRPRPGCVGALEDRAAAPGWAPGPGASETPGPRPAPGRVRPPDRPAQPAVSRRTSDCYARVHLGGAS